MREPENWPYNARTLKLEEVYRVTQHFMNSKDSDTKAKLCRILDSCGVVDDRCHGSIETSDYEIALINFLYSSATMINFPLLKTYLYEYIRMYVISQHQRTIITGEITSYYAVGLIGPLKYFAIIYENYRYLDGSATFVDEVLFLIKELISELDADQLFYMAGDFTFLLNDLSYHSSFEFAKLFAFNKQELKRLFKMQASLYRKLNLKANESPQRGMLNMTISNFILRSRNDYNCDVMCKYMSTDASCKALANGQIWMRRIEFLNDKRELKPLPTIFAKKSWIKYEWAKKIDFAPKRNYYVTSFCKELCSEKMSKKYGKNVFGFKNDRIMSELMPINKKEYAWLGQVICCDILYDYNTAKEEINFLCQIIDLYDMTREKKMNFLTI